MNFDFSDEQKQMRDEARKFLAEKCPPKAVRAVLDGKATYDKELWKGLAEMVSSGLRSPKARRRRRWPSRTLRSPGNGRALAPVPFSSTVYLAAEAHCCRQRNKQQWLLRLRPRGDRNVAVRRQGQSVAAGIKLQAPAPPSMAKPVPDGTIAVLPLLPLASDRPGAT
jgi:hypothetical protein